MKEFAARLVWCVAIAAVLFSPIALVLWIPFAMGAGYDVGDLQNVRVAALLLWAPVGVVVLLQLLRQQPAGLLEEPVRVSSAS